MRRPNSGGLVYSTEVGRTCPTCRQAIGVCVCGKVASATVPGNGNGNGNVRVSRETKGRGGKVVTLVRGLALDPVALAALGKELRSACGCGGTVKDGVLEIQGDHVARLIELLTMKGWKAKQAGG